MVGDDEDPPSIGVRENFYNLVGNQGEALNTARNESIGADGFRYHHQMAGMSPLCWTHFIRRPDFQGHYKSYFSPVPSTWPTFRTVSVCSPLHVGDIVTTEAKIASVINTDAGKAVKVIGNITPEGGPLSKLLLHSYIAVTSRIMKAPSRSSKYPTMWWNTRLILLLMFCCRKNGSSCAISPNS